MKKLPYLILIAAASFFFASCASVQQTNLTSNSTLDQTWHACVDAVSDIGYSVSSVDRQSGMIIADQAVFMGNGEVARLNISLQQNGDDVSVSVKFIPPPGTIGGGDVVSGYIKALKKRIPNIRVIK